MRQRFGSRRSFHLIQGDDPPLACGDRAGLGHDQSTGRDRDRGETVTAELIAHGTDARFVAADMALADAPSAVVDFAEETFGRIDVLVNCAAITDRDTIWDSTPTFFDRMIAINTGAPLFMMQETARVMRREGTEGMMVNVLSTSAHGGNRSSCLTAEPRGRWQP